MAEGKQYALGIGILTMSSEEMCALLSIFFHGTLLILCALQPLNQQRHRSREYALLERRVVERKGRGKLSGFVYR